MSLSGNKRARKEEEEEKQKKSYVTLLVEKIRHSDLRTREDDPRTIEIYKEDVYVICQGSHRYCKMKMIESAYEESKKKSYAEWHNENIDGILKECIVNEDTMVTFMVKENNDPPQKKEKQWIILKTKMLFGEIPETKIFDNGDWDHCFFIMKMYAMSAAAEIERESRRAESFEYTERDYDEVFTLDKKYRNKECGFFFSYQNVRLKIMSIE